MSIPDQVIIYRPHNIAYARYGEKWFKVISSLGGNEYLVSPQPVSLEEVSHSGCDQACHKTVFRRRNDLLVRDRIWEPVPKNLKLKKPPLKLEIGKRLFVTLLLILVVFPSSLFFMASTSSRGAGLTFRPLVKGDLYRNTKGWWRILDLFEDETLAQDKIKLSRFKSFQQKKYVTERLTQKIDGRRSEQTVHLVLVPIQPPIWAR